MEKTSSLRSSFKDEVRGGSPGETTETLKEGTHNQSRLSTLPESDICNRSSNTFSNLENMDSLGENEQEDSHNLSMNPDGSGLNPINSSTPKEKGTGRPQKTRKRCQIGMGTIYVGGSIIAIVYYQQGNSRGFILDS